MRFQKVFYMSDTWRHYLHLFRIPILPCLKRIEVLFPFKIGMVDFSGIGFKKANVWLLSERRIFLLGYAMPLIIVANYFHGKGRNV